MKQDVKAAWGNLYIDGFSFESIRREMDDIERQIKKLGGHSAYIDYNYYGYDGGFEIMVMYSRPETDKEYKKRLELEEKCKKEKDRLKQKKDERDLKEYQRLKKKFEGKE